MLVASRAVVLGSLRYSDSSVVLKAYTEAAGLRSLLVQVGKGPKAQAKAVLLQPLSLVQLSFIPEKHGLVRASGIERLKALSHIPFHPLKTSLALFVAEVVAKATHEDHADPAVFTFLFNAVTELDQTTGSLTYYPHQFMLGFCEHLGLRPAIEPGHPVFDLMEGRSTARFPAHVHHVAGHEFALLCHILAGQAQPNVSSQVRFNLLQALVDYLRIHLHGMREVNSHHILREVLH